MCPQPAVDRGIYDHYLLADSEESPSRLWGLSGFTFRMQLSRCAGRVNAKAAPPAARLLSQRRPPTSRAKRSADPMPPS